MTERLVHKLLFYPIEGFFEYTHALPKDIIFFAHKDNNFAILLIFVWIACKRASPPAPLLLLRLKETGLLKGIKK